MGAETLIRAIIYSLLIWSNETLGEKSKLFPSHGLVLSAMDNAILIGSNTDLSYIFHFSINLGHFGNETLKRTCPTNTKKELRRFNQQLVTKLTTKLKTYGYPIINHETTQNPNQPTLSPNDTLNQFQQFQRDDPDGSMFESMNETYNEYDDSLETSYENEAPIEFDLPTEPIIENIKTNKSLDIESGCLCLSSECRCSSIQPGNSLWLKPPTHNGTVKMFFNLQFNTTEITHTVMNGGNDAIVRIADDKNQPVLLVKLTSNGTLSNFTIGDHLPIVEIKFNQNTQGIVMEYAHKMCAYHPLKINCTSLTPVSFEVIFEKMDELEHLLGNRRRRELSSFLGLMTRTGSQELIQSALLSTNQFHQQDEHRIDDLELSLKKSQQVLAGQSRVLTDFKQAVCATASSSAMRSQMATATTLSNLYEMELLSFLDKCHRGTLDRLDVNSRTRLCNVYLDAQH